MIGQTDKQRLRLCISTLRIFKATSHRSGHSAMKSCINLQAWVDFEVSQRIEFTALTQSHYFPTLGMSILELSMFLALVLRSESGELATFGSL